MQVGYLAEYLSLYSEVGTALISEVLSRWNAVDFQFFFGVGIIQKIWLPAFFCVFGTKWTGNCSSWFASL
jgi:hypothetical protein